MFLISCDEIDSPIVEQKTGTDFLSFSLTDGFHTYPSFAICDTAVFVSVPNHGDFSSLRSVFTHNGETVSVSGVVQKSNESINDYSDFTKPLHFTVTSIDGKKKDYRIHLFDLPVVVIDTHDYKPIDSKENWIPASVRVINTDGTILLDTQLSIKGRGNGSWTSDSYLKKSYSVKFDKKQEVLGMPKSKRWVLIGTAADHTKIRTPLCFELSKILGYKWSPSGKNIELILNGQMLCNYFFSEQIRAEKNRIDIQEMAPSDTTGVALTGGVLFEVSEEYDEEYKFRSPYFNLPFMLKSPNDSVSSVQMEYFQSFVEKVEESLYDQALLNNNEYLKYMDADSYVRWWLVNNICMNREVLYNAKNFYMYKDRGFDTKLTAGPPWDFDWGTFWNSLSEQWISKDRYWFAKLFSNVFFVERVKTIWSDVRSDLDIVIDELVAEKRVTNRNSVLRDQYLYPISNSNEENGMEYEDAIDYIVGVYKKRLQWLDENIGNLK